MLLFEEYILASDDDLEIASDIVVGFDDDKNFVVELIKTNYMVSHGGERRVRAVVDKEEALLLADYLNVRLTALPKCFDQRFGEFSNILKPSYVDAQFKEILEFILDCGVHYRLKGFLP